MVDVPRDRFEELVSDALDEVPEELLRLMDNVVVLVEERDSGDPSLLGLYEGVALTERGHDYGGMLPDQHPVVQHPDRQPAGTGERVGRRSHDLKLVSPSPARAVGHRRCRSGGRSRARR